MISPTIGGAATRWGVAAVILLSISLALYLGKTIFIPTVIALLLAAMLWPMASWMHSAGVPLIATRRREGFPYFGFRVVRWQMGWGLATFTVIIGFVLCAVGLAVAFSLGLSKIIIDAGDAEKQKMVYRAVVSKLQSLGIPLDDEYLPPEPVDSKDPYNREKGSKVFWSVQAFFDFQNPDFRQAVGWAAGYGGNIIWQSILIMFILLFMLLEGKMLSRRIVEVFGPTAAVQGKAVEAIKEMAYQVRAYLVWRTIINFGMAAVLGIVYQLLGLKLAWTWALLTSVLWYIPYLGPIAAGIPPILDAFISCPSPWVAVSILTFYFVWVIIEGYFVVPVVMGRSMEMNATTVMLACLYWEHVWGAMGLFLAMPLIAAVKAVCFHVPEWRPWANLMSSHDETEPSEQPGPPQPEETHVDHAPAPEQPVAP